MVTHPPSFPGSSSGFWESPAMATEESIKIFMMLSVLQEVHLAENCHIGKRRRLDSRINFP